LRDPDDPYDDYYYSDPRDDEDYEDDDEDYEDDEY
jgi:hypothetical protein